MAYIGSWPEDVDFSTVNFKAQSVTKQTVTQSGRRLRFSVGGTRFAATIQYPPMTLANWLPIQAAVTRSQGPLNSFDIKLPKISENQSGVTGITATVTGDTAAGSSSVVLATNKNSTTILLAGAVVKFAGHNKVYMLTSDATTDVGGAVTLNITPNLIEGITNGAVCTLDDVPFRMTLSNDVQQYQYATSGLVSYELDVIEEE